MERVFALLQRDQPSLAEPLHQECHGRHEIGLFQQRGHDQGISLWRGEVRDVLAPKGDVARRGAGLVKGPQRLGHFAGRIVGLGAAERFDALDARGGKLVPPFGQCLHPWRKLAGESYVLARRRLAVQSGKERDELLQHFD